MSWWDDAVGYEIYIRSFADGNGDGVGDFIGATSRLEHLAWLGIDIVWVTPFYPSPQADFGYDVADYTGVDPQFGTMADFEAFAARVHDLGMRVMIDLVPNHTSSQHPWFRQALADPEGPYRDYFLFRSPGPDGGPPNNWVSHFGGPAWTLDEASGEYYCHLFLPDQPDLNWANEAVRAEFDRILAFWIDQGVDGFRIDVAHSLTKHVTFADNPQLVPVGPESTPGQAFAAFEHRHDLYQPETRDVYRRWKALPGADAVLLLGELYVKDPAVSASYLDDGGLDLCLFFALNRRPWNPAAFVDELRAWSESHPHGYAWTISSHDENRPVTRFGGGRAGHQRALALWTGLAMLPGVPFLYQGEELGLEDGYVAPDHVQDPVGKEAYEEGRDPCRTPMPWEPGRHCGFTSADQAWLIAGERDDHETVTVQRADPDSPLQAYRRLLALRRGLTEVRRGPAVWQPALPGVAHFEIGEIGVIVNLTDSAVNLPTPTARVLYSSGDLTDPGRTGVSVPARTGLVYAKK